MIVFYYICGRTIKNITDSGKNIQIHFLDFVVIPLVYYLETSIGHPRKVVPRDVLAVHDLFQMYADPAIFVYSYD